MTKVTKLYEDLRVRLEKYTKVLSGHKSRLYWDIVFDDQPYDAFVVTGAKHNSRDPVCTHIWIKPTNAQQDDTLYPYDGFRMVSSGVYQLRLWTYAQITVLVLQ